MQVITNGRHKVIILVYLAFKQIFWYIFKIIYLIMNVKARNISHIHGTDFELSWSAKKEA